MSSHHQPDQQDTMQPVRVAFGKVVNVRSIPTRGVTRIEIEVPIEAHVEATRTLFDQNVFVMPASIDSGAYGMIDGAVPACEPSHEVTPSNGTDPSRPALFATRHKSSAAASHAPPNRAGLGPVANTVDILKWLGARCREDHFQDWLGVRTEGAAIDRVRQECGVASRAEIPANPHARKCFFEKIFHPYRRATQSGHEAADETT